MFAVLVQVPPFFVEASIWLTLASFAVLMIFQAQKIDKRRVGVVVALLFAIGAAVVFADEVINPCSLLEKYSAAWWAGHCYWYEIFS